MKQAATILKGDSGLLIPGLTDAFDACITDPPYGIGFMNKVWDNDVAFDPAFWFKVRKRLKPGAHLLAFGGTRTYHRLTVAIEDAGFEIRDCIAWVYGQGMGKSGSLKPAFEPIVVARNPVEGKVADNFAKYGVGQYFIEQARVPHQAGEKAGVSREGEASANKVYSKDKAGFKVRPGVRGGAAQGRWPANIVHDGSDEILEVFPDAPGQQGVSRTDGGLKTGNIYGKMKYSEIPHVPRGDTGSAARFFYCAKATRKERMASDHPTVKPLALMQYLIRLVTPEGAHILEPFGGSGTTMEAALLENRRCTIIEREDAYHPDIAARLQRAMSRK